MKYTFNMANVVMTTTADRTYFNPEGKEERSKEVDLNFKMEGISVTVECDVTEMDVMMKSVLDMRNALVEGTKQVLPIIKTGLIEVGKVFSDEAFRHRQLDHSFRMEQLEAERKAEDEKQNNWKERHSKV